MSRLKHLAATADRALARLSYAASIRVEDATGAITCHSPPPTGFGTPPDHLEVARLVQVMMQAAPAGSVATVTTENPTKSTTLTAPGGAYDNRPPSPPAPSPDTIMSPSADLRPLAPGVRLTQPTRALRIVVAGDLEVRTVGTPSELQPPFPAPVGLIPLQVTEIGEGTTATVLGMF
ncbi:hypothetical protein vBDshSR4C_023 [Dinoroseobacter phage vB_DshS-R4C]|nr:hypothetical protein vBDshSR4C_023 [Dinoroseobacter phage vB_DshS-R4C]